MRRVPLTLRVPDLHPVAEDDSEQVSEEVSSILRNWNRATPQPTIRETSPGSLPMPPANTRKHDLAKGKASAGAKPSDTKDLVLHGDVEALTLAFVSSQRRLVSVSVPETLYMKLQRYPGGVSKFYEDAVAKFDGDLKALVEAAVRFIENRRACAAEDPARNASGRVQPQTFETIRKIELALATVRGMSRSKILAGLVQLHVHNIPKLRR